MRTHPDAEGNIDTASDEELRLIVLSNFVARPEFATNPPAYKSDEECALSGSCSCASPYSDVKVYADTRTSTAASSAAEPKAARGKETHRQGKRGQLRQGQDPSQEIGRAYSLSMSLGSACLLTHGWGGQGATADDSGALAIMDMGTRGILSSLALSDVISIQAAQHVRFY